MSTQQEAMRQRPGPGARVSRKSRIRWARCLQPETHVAWGPETLRRLRWELGHWHGAGILRCAGLFPPRKALTFFRVGIEQDRPASICGQDPSVGYATLLDVKRAVCELHGWTLVDAADFRGPGAGPWTWTRPDDWRFTIRRERRGAGFRFALFAAHAWRPARGCGGRPSLESAQRLAEEWTPDG